MNGNQSIVRDAILAAKDFSDRIKELGPSGVYVEAKEQPRYWYRVMRQTVKLFFENRGPYQANALAYRSMISLVPMLAFMISLLTWLMPYQLENLTEKLQQVMKQYVVPESQIIQSTFEFIDKFINQAQQGAQFGFIIMLVTSILLINGIEVIFNNIWHVTHRRPYGWRVLSYTALTVLIPLMLGLSMYMTAQVQVESIERAVQENLGLARLPLFTWTWSLFKDLGIPMAIVWALFLAVYKWLPNTRVEFWPALIGSLVAAAAFEIGKWGFSFFAAKMVEGRQLWWGTMGVFLVFLVWVYLVWWIILFCAQLTYVIQNYRFALRKRDELDFRAGDVYLASRVMLEISKSHFHGDPAPTVSELAESLGIDVPRIQATLARLMEANLIILGTSPGGRRTREEVHVPGRDLGSITVADVVMAATDAWQMPGPRVHFENPDRSDDAPADPPKTPEETLDRLLDVSLGTSKSYLKVTLREILE